MTAKRTNHIQAIDRSDVALLPVRTALGATMLYHGLQKVRPQAREQATQMFEKMGVRPGRPWSLATGLAETFAGAAMLAGILIRPAALAVLVTQSVAIAKVHGGKGFSNTKGGFEFNLALMAIAAAVLAAGPGRVSVKGLIDRTNLASSSFADRLLRRRRRHRSFAARLLALLG
jgi:putative oxidoreductase